MMKASELGVLPETIDETFAPTVSPSVAAVEVDGEAVLYDEATGALHVLNPSATLLWFCFDGQGTLGEIADDIVDATGLDRPTVGRDVVEMAQRLGREGLLLGVEHERPPLDTAGTTPEGVPDSDGVTDSRAPRRLANPPSR